MTFTLVRATADDTAVVAELLTARATWLAERGFAQWSKKDPARDTSATIAAGETWLLLDEARRTVGTITLSTRADHDFWSRSERSVPALYTSKIATGLEYAGQGLGQLLLHAGFMYARRRGLSVLRWDVWRTNQSLQTYYQSLGARLLRVVEVPGRSSGALFEWRAMDRAVWQAGSPGLVTIDAPEGEIQLLGSVTEHTVVRAGADACDRLQPTRADHVHTTVDLSTAASTQAVTVSPTDTSPSILFHAGDAWRLDGARVSGPLLDNLQPGLVYRIAHKGVPGDCHVVLLGEQVDAAWAPRPYVEAL